MIWVWIMLKKRIEPFCPGVSAEYKYILMCDGHGPHLTLALCVLGDMSWSVEYAFFIHFMVHTACANS